MVEDVLVLPYARQNLIGEVYENARVLSETYDETGRVLTIRGLPGAIARLRRSVETRLRTVDKQTLTVLVTKS